MLKKLISIILFNLLFSNVFAQHFSIGIETLASPGEIMINNYTALQYLINEKDGHNFNQNNIYTYTIVVKDVEGVLYHILYQTDFIGTLQYLAISNNLFMYFNCDNYPIGCWNACLRKVNTDDLPSEVIKNKISCIIARLNYCSN